MATWLSQTWKEYFEGDGQSRVVKSFQRVGLLNAFDGSENNLVKVQSVENYCFDESEDDSSESDGDTSDGEHSEIDETSESESEEVSSEDEPLV